MSQPFPQVQVEGKTAVFSGEVRPSTRDDAAAGDTFTIWQLGTMSVNGGPALSISATCDSERSIRSAASRLAKNGNTYLTKRVAPALVSEQVDHDTMEFTASIALSVPGFDSPKVLDMRTQTKLPRSAYGFFNKVRIAERTAAHRMLADVFERVARNVYVQVPQVDAKADEPAVVESDGAEEMPAF